MNLKSGEKMFFGQKLKSRFFKESDKGTRFFHSLMSLRHRRNHIPALYCDNGVFTSLVEDVGKECVKFYQQLLGTSIDTLPPDVNVVQSGPCLGADSFPFLLAPVSCTDIKKALFSIGYKAP